MNQLSEAEKARYEWQMWTPDVGEEGQQKHTNGNGNENTPYVLHGRKPHQVRKDEGCT